MSDYPDLPYYEEWSKLVIERDNKIASLESERDSLRAALESLTSAWFAGVSGSPDRTEVSRYCVYCSGYMSFTSAVNTNETPFAHKPDCPIARARKLYEETKPNGE